ncbi:hypothetical protein ACWC4A_52085, partial [Streptomyces mirabilis]
EPAHGVGTSTADHQDDRPLGREDRLHQLSAPPDLSDRDDRLDALRLEAEDVWGEADSIWARSRRGALRRVRRAHRF